MIIRLVLFVSLILTPTLARAQVAPAPAATRATDAAEIRALGTAWQDAWNRRDAAGLAAIMDEDVVFVSVLGPDTPGYGRGGRAAFQAGHAAILASPMFADSRWTTEQVEIVRWLTPDIAVAHVVWTTTGDRVRHLAPGTPRRGMFTWVVNKGADGRWRVAASQNTEVMPPFAPK